MGSSLARTLFPMQIVGPVKKKFCEPCVLAKQYRTSSHSPILDIDSLFYRIYIDILRGKESLPRIIRDYKYT